MEGGFTSILLKMLVLMLVDLLKMKLIVTWEELYFLLEPVLLILRKLNF